MPPAIEIQVAAAKLAELGRALREAAAVVAAFDLSDASAALNEWDRYFAELRRRFLAAARRTDRPPTPRPMASPIGAGPPRHDTRPRWPTGFL